MLSVISEQMLCKAGEFDCDQVRAGRYPEQSEVAGSVTDGRPHLAGLEVLQSDGGAGNTPRCWS